MDFIKLLSRPKVMRTGFRMNLNVTWSGVLSRIGHYPLQA